MEWNNLHDYYLNINDPEVIVSHQEFQFDCINQDEWKSSQSNYYFCCPFVRALLLPPIDVQKSCSAIFAPDPAQTVFVCYEKEKQALYC